MADWAWIQAGPDLVMTSEVIRNFAIGIGAVLSVFIGLPILKIVWDAKGLVKDIQSDAKIAVLAAQNSNNRFDEFMERVSTILERHDSELEVLKADKVRREGFEQGRKIGHQRFDDTHGEEAV